MFAPCIAPSRSVLLDNVLLPVHWALVLAGRVPCWWVSVQLVGLPCADLLLLLQAPGWAQCPVVWHKAPRTRVWAGACTVCGDRQLAAESCLHIQIHGACAAAPEMVCGLWRLFFCPQGSRAGLVRACAHLCSTLCLCVCLRRRTAQLKNGFSQPCSCPPLKAWLCCTHVDCRLPEVKSQTHHVDIDARMGWADTCCPNPECHTFNGYIQTKTCPKAHPTRAARKAVSGSCTEGAEGTHPPAAATPALPALQKRQNLGSQP